MHLSALAYVAFLLFVVTVLVNAGARLLIWRVARGSGRREQQAPVNRRVLRRALSNLMVGLMIGAVDRGAAAAVLHPAQPGDEGRRQPLARLLHQDAGARRRDRRRRGPRHRRHAASSSGVASLIGLPDRHRRGHLLRRVSRAAGSPGSTRFVADVLNGTPSIVVGVFAWAWIVATQKHFSALAGSAALAMLMIPMVLRTTEEMIKLVPNSLREAALALGYPALAHQPVGRGAHHAAGHRHRQPAGRRAHRRRDGAAAVHRAGQPVPELPT